MKAISRLVPAPRRVKGLGGMRGRRLLQARKLVAPLVPLPVTLTAADGLRLRITADPVDEQIARHLTGARRSDYFPPWPTGAEPVRSILDIGAHHGLYAVAALHEYRDAQIVCVEPSASALSSLHANLALNGFTDRARVVHAGLAAERGSGLLRHTAEGSWGASLYEEATAALATEAVALLPLAEILDGERPDVVKCNAEGAEYALIPQLRALDVRPRLMVVMVHPEFGDLNALLAAAADAGYESTSIGVNPQRPAFHFWRT
ncbi:MAG TPA: FkbM family methyltransferase [Acidimicrobiia bacterium]|nr:FkbM family methyltransferase [Acidimicrobiia bacterium]